MGQTFLYCDWIFRAPGTLHFEQPRCSNVVSKVYLILPQSQLFWPKRVINFGNYFGEASGGAAGGGRGHARAQAATSATSAWRQVAEK